MSIEDDQRPASIVVRVFGGLEVSGPASGSGSITTQSKRVALLAYLTLATPRGLHRRDSLLHLFWPDLDQSRARAALRQSVYYLRKSLDADVFTSEGDESIGVDHGAVDCDALAFEDALQRGDPERALELYRGEPFAGFHVPDIDPDLDDWFHATAERYRAKAAAAARWLAERDLDVDPARAAEWSRRALELDPEDESALRLRIRALDATGDRIAAIRAYEAFVEWLEEEYGIEPEAETRSLIEEIRSRTPVEEIEREEAGIVPLTPVRATRWRKTLPAALAGGVVLVAVTAWVAWGLTRAEGSDDGGIRDPAPVAPFVEPQLGGLHDLRIVFLSLRDGNQELYAINADGTELERLTNTSAREWEPIWTPDGRILFTSDREGSQDIYLMDGDGSNVQRLTDHPARESVTAISPDGSTIAFRSDRAGAALALYLMDVDGSNVRLVEDGHASVTGFSPAGDRLVFGSMRAAAGDTRNSEIFVLDLDRGEPPVRLTHAWSYDDHPDWSPDGRKIGFSTGRHGFYNHEVYVMDPDGSDQTNLTRSASKDARPRWSPDGSKIVFFSDRAGGYDLFVMDADGSNVRRITREGGAQHDVRGPLPLPPVCLVHNGSFEEVEDERLPPGSDAFAGVPGWRAHVALHVKGGVANSPDVFVPGDGVPDNRYGYQFPAHGRNYAGFATSGTNPVGATEALAATLKGSLFAGRAYELRAHLSNGDSRADWNFLEVFLHSTRTGVSLPVDTLRSSVDQTWVRLTKRISIAPGDTNAYDELVFRGSYPAAKPEGYWYVDDVDVCPLD